MYGLPISVGMACNLHADHGDSRVGEVRRDNVEHALLIAPWRFTKLRVLIKNNAE